MSTDTELQRAIADIESLAHEAGESLPLTTEWSQSDELRRASAAIGNAMRGRTMFSSDRSVIIPAACLVPPPV